LLQLKHISDIKIRNFVRGALSQAKGDWQSPKSKSLTATLNSIQKLADATAIRQAYEVMRNHPIGDSFLPETFPRTPHRPASTLMLVSSPLISEVAKQIGNIGKDLNLIEKYFYDFNKLNKAILSADWESIPDLVSKITNLYGMSLHLLAKMVSLKEMRVPSSILTQCDFIIEQWLKPNATVVVAAIRDSISSGNSYVETRRRFLSYIERGYVSTKNSAVINYIFNGSSNDADEFSLQIQALGQYSAIDGMLTILCAIHSKQHLDVLVQDEIKGLYEIWLNSSKEIDVKNIFALMPATIEFKDYNFLRHLFSWRDLPNVHCHQMIVQAALGERINGSFSLKASDKFISSPKGSLQSEHIFGDNYELTDNFITISTTSTFINTIVLIEQFFDQGNLPDLGENTLANLLDQTIDLAYLISPEEIDRLIDIDKSQERKTLNQYLVSAIADDAEQTDSSSFRFRKRLETLVRSNYDSDLMAFLYDMHKSAPRVADHLFEAASELFLSQLFIILEKPNDVTIARAALLEWRANAYPDPDNVFMNMAKSLRTSLRFQNLKQQKNEQRIYVDPDKFTIYLKDRIVPELVKSSNIAKPTLSAQNFLSLSNPVKVIENPGLEFSNLLQIAFKNFYTDPRFGLDSYVGRRIRHGTLSGTLLTEVSTTIKKFYSKNVDLPPSSIAYIDQWLKNYREMIEKIRDEYLQVQTSSKKHGLFIASLSEGKRAASVANYVEELRVVIQQGVLEVSLPPVIIDIFWRIADSDIQNARAVIGKIKGKHVFKAPRNLQEEHQTAVRSLALEVNAIVDRKFKLLDEWLKRPQTSTVHTNFKEICEVLVDEAKERFEEFSPTVTITGEAESDLIGARIRDILDIIEIIIVNAAQHGKNDGYLKVHISSSSQSGRHAIWNIEVSSELQDGDTRINVEKKLKEASERESSEAFLVEGKSGFRKINLILSDKEFSGNATTHVTEDEFKVKVQLKLINA